MILSALLIKALFSSEDLSPGQVQIKLLVISSILGMLGSMVEPEELVLFHRNTLSLLRLTMMRIVAQNPQ